MLLLLTRVVLLLPLHPLPELLPDSAEAMLAVATEMSMPTHSSSPATDEEEDCWRSCV